MSTTCTSAAAPAMCCTCTVNSPRPAVPHTRTLFTTSVTTTSIPGIPAIVVPSFGPTLSGSAKKCRSWMRRSEEHTSELQSRPHLVCRLLLEKKKKQQKSPADNRIERGRHHHIQR